MNYKHYYVKDGLAIEWHQDNRRLPVEDYTNFRGTEDGVTYHHKITLVNEGTTHYLYLEDQELTDYWEGIMEKQYKEYESKINENK